jgi:hypothetical protein
MERIRVSLKKTEDKSYEIIVGEETLKQIAPDLKRENIAYSYVIVTDFTVAPLYGKGYLNVLNVLN